MHAVFGPAHVTGANIKRYLDIHLYLCTLPILDTSVTIFKHAGCLTSTQIFSTASVAVGPWPPSLVTMASCVFKYAEKC